MSSSTTRVLLKVAAALWVVWGFVHVAGGVRTMASETGPAIAAIADAVDPATLDIPYPDAVGGIINQRGFNLFWIGLATIGGAVLIWRANAAAIFITALIGWSADIGYFLFMDLGGFVNFFPGTVMTIVSTLAVGLSFLAHFKGMRNAAPSPSA